MDTNTAVAYWTLGLLQPQQMRQVAQGLLASGVDSKLHVLAGLSDSELDEAPDLFSQTMHALGRDKLTKPDAVRIIAKAVARQITQGDLSPYDGARRIWNASLEVAEQGFHDVDPFIYAASEYEDRPDDRDHFAAEIVAEAQRWLKHE